MTEPNDVQQRISELEASLALPLPDSVQRILHNELNTLLVPPFHAGLYRRTKRILAGTAGAMGVGFLVAGGLAPLCMAIPPTAIATWATTMGANALAGWLADWAVRHGDALLSDGATEEQIAAAMQAELEQNPDLTNDVATVLIQTESIATTLDAIAQETNWQSDTLLVQLRFIEHLLAGQRRSDLIQGSLHRQLIATLHEQQTTLVDAYERGTQTLSDEHCAILDAIAQIDESLGIHGSVDISGTATATVAVGVNQGTIIATTIYGPHDEEQRKRLVRYLERLAAKLTTLPLRGLADTLDRQGKGMALPAVYTMLATTRTVDVAHGTKEELQSYFHKDTLKQDYDPGYALPMDARVVLHDRIVDTDGHGRVDSAGNHIVVSRLRLARAVLATEAVQQQRRMVLLGVPGGGKSTFVRHLAWVLAQRGLDRVSETTTLAGWADEQRLLPVVLPLRTLAGRLCGIHEDAYDTTVSAALQEALVQYDYAADDATHLLRESLRQGGALLLLDGLDEVPLDATATTADRRSTLHAIRSFIHLYPEARVLVTCRTRAFSDDVRACLGWPVDELAPFTLGQVRHFVPAWYGELAEKGHLEPERVECLSADLITSIVDRSRLREMAATPLLLTMMALLLYNKGELPRDRAWLYEAILDLLFGQWDKVKEGQSLAEVIGGDEWSSARIRPVLYRLSYEAHRTAASEDGRGRLSWGSIHHALVTYFAESGMRRDTAAAAAVRCLEYFVQRSGLLMPDEQDSFVFAHLTVQEHCAGRYIVTGRDSVGLMLEHRGDDRWREPIFLGLGVIQQTNPFLIESVLNRFVADDEEGNPKPKDRRQRDILLAAELGKDRDWGYLRQLGVAVAPIQKALRAGLVALLADPAQPLPVAERIRAGYLLGDLGDPRVLDPTTGNAPAGDYWCEVEAGPFWYGDDRKGNLRQMTLPYRYRIGRYLVTNAEYARFVDAGGYADRQWWTEQGWREQESRNWTQPHHWDDERWNAPNQPVVGVTWYEAVAYCAWLTAQGRAAGWLAAGEVIRLPTSLEWERAARGTDRRRYPWGDEEPSEEHANYGKHIGKTTPIGCYPQGIAACGALDMAGQVMEWLATPDGSREQVEPQADSDRNSVMLLTRSEWLCQTEHLYCGSRGRVFPHDWHFFWGFRLLPPSPKEQ